MHEVSEVEIDAVAQPMAIFTQLNKLKPMELADAETDLTQNHRSNGALPPLGTQAYLPHLPLTETSVALDNPSICPHLP